MKKKINKLFIKNYFNFANTIHKDITFAKKKLIHKILIYYFNKGTLTKTLTGESIFIDENIPKRGLFEDEKQIIKARILFFYYKYNKI